MADDGMLVNFSIGDETLHTKPIFRGGRWKDRLAAKKAAERRYQKYQPEKEPETSNGIGASHEEKDTTATERPPKRQKFDTSSTHHPKPRPNGATKEVVSSLFSYNPASISAPADLQPQDETPTVPSNAPLPDGISKFTDLGLSSTISTHLLTKMSLKAPTAIQRSTITKLLQEDSDAFLQAETGSGKTLAYLLPIVQRIMHLSGETGGEKKINRDSGLFAIILAPTRELCKQILTVVESLLRCANWIVAGTVIGGEKKKSEKARLRKGVNVLVATPGRLVDHLDNTKVLDVGHVRWLVLDEGDRLVELGFEEDIKKIVQALDRRSKEVEDDGERTKRVAGLPSGRSTILCSATMKMNVQRLGEISLKDAVHIKAEPVNTNEDGEEGENDIETAFLAPAQLKQSYVIVPPKQRLVTLAAFLKHTFARKGSVMKAIVFLSCADSVDFHFEVFARKREPEKSAAGKERKKDHSTEHKETSDASPKAKMNPLLASTLSQSDTLASTPNPKLMIHKLHGSLTQQIRTATLSAFTHSLDPSILLCTDVASRGLDLPNIDLIVEYDPPFSSDDHLHRIGRTARAGREGRAVIFLMPGPEEAYVDILRQGYRDGVGRGLIRNEAEEFLKKGFGSAEAALAIDQTSVQGRDWSESAEHWQLKAERWVVDDNAKAGAMAKKAFVSHVRAYATHVARERTMFDVKALHLGHLAKAFALRERPGNFGRSDKATAKKGGSRKGDKARRDEVIAPDRAKAPKRNSETPIADGRDAVRKMQSKMKEHLAAASEFNIG
ncbi:MAG: hypothetical protein LQ350_000253 [Teloschistes chrysophthalmus]|nr:MAG: hypothetical protein LQ350_000253 [Niorma chrysophthalma]